MREERIAVVKVGGKEIAPGTTIERFSAWVARARAQGELLVIVHGGGEEVSERAAALGLPTVKHEGQRVTDAAMLEVVLEVLAGRVNARLVGALAGAGVAAVGVSGASDRLLSARIAGDPPGSLGFVGAPDRVRTHLLDVLLATGFTPVVAPLGRDPAGQLLNVNADRAAAALAAALHAPLFLVTDVPGVYGADRDVRARLTVAEARRLRRDGIARDGMIPKLTAAEEALAGAPSVWIGDLDGLVAGTGHAGTTLVASPRASGRRAPVPVRRANA